MKDKFLLLSIDLTSSVCHRIWGSICFACSPCQPSSFSKAKSHLPASAIWPGHFRIALCVFFKPGQLQNHWYGNDHSLLMWTKIIFAWKSLHLALSEDVFFFSEIKNGLRGPRGSKGKFGSIPARGAAKAFKTWPCFKIKIMHFTTFFKTNDFISWHWSFLFAYKLSNFLN